MAKHLLNRPAMGQHLKRTLCVGLFATLVAPASLLASQVQTTDSEALQLVQQEAGKRRQLIGSVVDGKTNEPIIGANVIVKGDNTRGAATAPDGSFRLNVAPGETLVVSYLGYKTKEVKVGKQAVIEITLSEDAAALGEVVVTAFGTGQRKATVTGAIQTVRPSDLVVPSANLSTSFAGRLSGVIAYQRSGEPGSNGANFYIRGISTLSGATSPLIIVDGVQVSQGDLNTIDPDIIESFSVLKDASATALYGARGANGVLIIQTKSGADLDRPVIGVRLESYVNTPIDVPKIADGPTFMRLYNEAIANESNGQLPYSEDRIQGTIERRNPYAFPNVDWYNELFKSATFNQKANVNIRGGGSKITYFMNVNAVHETGMLKGRSRDFYSFDNNIDLMRYAFQNNIDFKISPTTKIALHLNAQLENFHGPITGASSGGVGNIFGAIMQVNPVDFPILFPKDDDKWYHWGGINYGSQPIGNPMAAATAGYKDSFANTIIANINLDQKLDFITKGLTFKALFSFKNWTKTEIFRHQGYNKYEMSDYRIDQDGKYIIDQSALGTPTNHTLGSNSSTAGDRNMYFQTSLTYSNNFGKHGLGSLLLFDMSEYNNSVLGNNNLIGSLPKRRVGLAARLTYDYAHRYLLELNAGYTGTENFAKGHRWGLFPSVSLGWAVSQEKFWEPLKKVVSNLKLRASYGLVGNDQIGGARFVYLEEVALGHGDAPSYTTGYGSSRQSRKGPIYPRLRNEDLTWEVGRKLNLGMDLQLFNAFNLTAEVFQEIRSNIFQQRNSIPSILGVSYGKADNTKIYGNFAKVKNWGVDLAAEFNKRFSKDFTLQLKSTFTYTRNRILEYDEAPNKPEHRKAVGKPLNSIWGLVADGLYIDAADLAASPKSTFGSFAKAPGDIKFVDQPDIDGNYDGKISADDRVVMGYPTVPQIIYGFTPSMTYKKFDFSFHIQGQARVSLMMSGFAPFGDQERRNVLQWIADDHWSPDNQNPKAHHPRLTQRDNSHNMQSSSYWLRNAAFLRLKSAEIGYSFKNARVYLSATNLFRISPFKLWDPEMGGGRGMSYPLQRTFNLGVSLKFNR